MARILTDAPAVLGLAECRARDAATCEVLLDTALTDAVDVPGDREVAVALLLGVLNEAAALVASSPQPQRERKRVAATVDAFLERLLVPA